MNADDTKTLIQYTEDDIAEVLARRDRLKAACTHVHTDGSSALGTLSFDTVLGHIRLCDGCGRNITVPT